MGSAPPSATVRLVRSLADIAPEAWDACAVPDPATRNPFVQHAFLKALEESGTVSDRTGWSPHHVALEIDGRLAGCAPAYLKAHSQGEYIFDYGWADAYERAGGDYYPKLQIAVPFTPVPGPRLLVAPTAGTTPVRQTLASAIGEVVRQNGLSSAHVTFTTETEWRELAAAGFLQRTDQQFHWTNQGYSSFEQFLESFASRKRKAVRKERETARSAGLDIEWLLGRDITEAHWDAFFAFYLDTGNRKWGRPYLNRTFFSLLHEAMPESCLLIMARKGPDYIGGALNLVGGDCLYGRYWGAIEHYACLHFEVCYYQAIEYAIANGLSRVEAGAQGEHKLARGYLPTPTYSAHFIADPRFRAAVSDFLARERRHVERAIDALTTYAPYKRGPET
ncbi:MAG: GNAT family N-acetyltransferase [Hyphomicrobiaceae bacterium]